MADQLERIYEYRVLYAKQRELQIPLTQEERARALRLRQELPERVPSVDERDAFTVLSPPLSVQYVVSRGFGVGTLCNASANGLAVSTKEEPPGLGQRLLVHVHDAHQGLEYTFPCRVVARVIKSHRSMGLRFEGMPAQTRIGYTSGLRWRSDVFPPEEHIPPSSRQKPA